MGYYGCSNVFLKWVNILTAILSIPIIAVGIYLSTETGSECYTFLQKPVIVIGVFLFVLSLLGCVGAQKWGTVLLWIYLLLLGILILLLLIFVIFAFVVTSDGGGSTIAGYNFKEYRIGDYSGWLQGQINGTESWRKIKSCMIASDFCDELNTKFKSLAEYQNASLGPTESGCCRPPINCGYPQTNITTFTITNTTSLDPDCKLWSNNLTISCYDCSTCKGGVAQYVRSSWKTGSAVLVFVVFFLMLLYCIGCCARFNAKQPDFEDIEKEQFNTRYMRQERS